MPGDPATARQRLRAAAAISDKARGSGPILDHLHNALG